MYINDLPKTMSISANPVLFADDRSMIVTNPDLMEFTNFIIIIYLSWSWATC
jgi:hypothetical protein